MQQTKRNYYLTINLLLIIGLFVSINTLGQAILIYGILFFVVFLHKFSLIADDLKRNFKELVITAIPFLILLFSLIWSGDINRGLNQIIMRLPLILFPFAFIIQKDLCDNNFKDIIIMWFILACTCFSIYGFTIIFIYFPIDYTTNLTFIHIRYLLENEILNMHPVYLGLLCGLASVFSVHYIIKNVLKTHIKLLLSIAFLINTFTMLFISARMAIIATLSSLLVLLFFYKKYFLLILIITIAFTTIFLIQYNFPGYRFSEIFDTIKNISFTDIDKKSTIYTRQVVYNCVYRSFVTNPVFGFGIGDIQDIMFSCTKDYLGNDKFNSHNQYFEFLLSTGVIGLFAFIYYLSFLFKRFIRMKNILGVVILLFFIISFLSENIFARSRGVFIFSYLIYLIYDFKQKTENYC